MKDAFVLGKKGMTPYDFYNKLKGAFEKQFTTANDKGIFSASVGVATLDGVTIVPKKDGVKITTTTSTGESIANSSGTITITAKSGTTSLSSLQATLAATADGSKDLIDIIGMDYGAFANNVTAQDLPDAGLTITELAPLYKQDFVKMIDTNASMYTDTIMVNGASEHWGTVTKSVSSYTGNARKTAEWERFYMRARGENDGYLGYPYCDPAEMMIQSPGINDNFWYLNIKYLFRGEGMVNTDSPKDLTIVVSTALETSTGILSTAAALDALSQDTTYTTSSAPGNNKLMKDIITATGKSILFKYIA
jgi:hypothetical protein